MSCLMKMKNTLSLRNAFLLSLAVACALTASPFVLIAGAQRAVASKDAALGKVSAEAIKRHVNFLASDKLQGRRAVAPEADAAAKYIADEFRRSGLKPVSAAGFLQPFTFVSGVKLGNQNSFEVTNRRFGRVLQSESSFSTTDLKVGEDY